LQLTALIAQFMQFALQAGYLAFGFTQPVTGVGLVFFAARQVLAQVIDTAAQFAEVGLLFGDFGCGGIVCRKIFCLPWLASRKGQRRRGLPSVDGALH
jgi:hypothetical protein